MNFGVLGSGIVGLTTALELQRQFRQATVTIIADRFNEQTTSYVAAGIFRPGTSFIGPSEELTDKWLRDAYDYWHDLRVSSDAPLAGVTQLSGYIFSSTTPSIVRNHFLERLLPVYRRATPEELRLCHGDWKYGSFFTTCLTECRLFLPYATQQFLSNGGRIMRQHVNSFSEVSLRGYNVIVNCSGLGAKQLCQDKQLVPLRGQVLKVRAPWLKLAFYGDYDTYILPGFDTVTLGGCRQFDSYNEQVCPYDGMAIRARCYSMLPSLRNAELVQECVGLRPHRATVRVEPELITADADSRPLRLVHNYGHGGYGVTAAPGTAKYAAQLVRDVLTASGSKL